ncbi:hypothetical protein AC44_3460 [Escherichia coli 2-177-06_S3_C3]|nr:hypothetical protein AC44_3460 [Escherichia coli 2-177-06_S3_C3]
MFKNWMVLSFLPFQVVTFLLLHKLSSISLRSLATLKQR